MPDRKPRVMLVGPMPPTKGGVTTFMLNLMASPLNEEFEFVPFTTSRPPKRNVTENWGYRAMLRGGMRRIITGVLVTLWHMATFPLAVVSGRIDLVQIQASDYQVFWESAVYAVLAKMLRRPVLFRIGGAFDIFHGEASAQERKMIGIVLQLPDVVIAQSRFAGNYIRAAGRTGTMIELPNWARTVEFLSKRLPVEQPTCLFIAGQEARRKGADVVLMAAERLKAQGCKVHFHMIGVPPVLMESIARSTAADIVHADGPARHSEVLNMMQRYELFLLPSFGEGFPNSLVEAMAAGMACVATPVGAIPEMAADGGVEIVPTGDADALADAISRLASSPAARDRLGAQAQQTIQSRYVASAALPNLASAYRCLLAPEGNSSARL